jgi:hypothetical protein
MPNDGKTLNATLREVIGENVTSNDVKQEGIPENKISGSATDTKSGEPAREYVSGIDVSDIPEQDRPRIKELLTKKAKLLEDGYNPKFQKVAALAKAQEDLEKLGLNVDEARDVLIKHLETKKGVKPSEQAKNIRTLDKLIESSSDPEQKAALSQMRNIINEETGIKELTDKLERLDKFYSYQASELVGKRQGELEGELKQLESEYGSDVIEKYKDDVIKHGVNSKAKAEDLLYAIAGSAVIKESILKSKQQGKLLTEDKRNAISSTNSGITGSHENLDTKKMNYKGLFHELIKK